MIIGINKFKFIYIKSIKEEMKKCLYLTIITSAESYNRVDELVRKMKCSDLVTVLKVSNDNFFNSKDEDFFEITLEEAIENCEDFNKESYSLLKEVNESLCISAKAGTGKTYLITHLATMLLIKGLCEPEEIIFSTFTNNSTDELSDRLYQCIYNIWIATNDKAARKILDNYSKISIMTLDKLITRWLADIGYIYGLGFDVTNASFTYEINSIIENTIRDFLSIDTNDRVFSDKKLYYSYLYIVIKEIINSNKYTIMDIIDAKFYENNDDIVVSLFVELLKSISNQIIDFLKVKMLETSVVNIKEKYSFLKEALDNLTVTNSCFNNIKYLFVDEAQDCSKDQVNIILKMKSLFPDANFIYVGDYLQGIYGFRGASHDSMDLLSNSTEEHNVNLLINYRSSKKVINLVNDFCNTNIPGFEPIKYCSWASEGEARIVKDTLANSIKIGNLPSGFINDFLAEVNCLRSYREELKKDNKQIKNSDKLVILTRNNKEGKMIKSILSRNEEIIRNNITIGLSNSGSLYRTKAARDLRVLVKIIINPESIYNNINILDTAYANFKHLYDSKSIAKLKDEVIFRITEPIIETIKGTENNNMTQFQYLNVLIEKLIKSDVTDEYWYDLNKILEELFSKRIIFSLFDIERHLSFSALTDFDTKSYCDENDDVEVLIETMHISKGLEYYNVIVIADSKIKLNKKGNINQRFILYRGNGGFKIERSIGKDVYTIKSQFYDIQNYSKNGENINLEGIEKKNLKDGENINLEEIEKKNLKDGEIHLLYVALTRARERLLVYCNCTEGNLGCYFEK